MKNWLKYILLSLSLILLVGSKYFASSSASQQLVTHTLLKKAENKNVFSNSNHYTVSNTDEILVELDEEDNPHFDEFSGLSFNNFLYNEVFAIFHTLFLWKKIAFNNLELGTLQSKIFILVLNLRI